MALLRIISERLVLVKLVVSVRLSRTNEYLGRAEALLALQRKTRNSEFEKGFRARYFSFY